MNDLVFVMPRGRGNHSSGEKRSKDGRKGRGEDAFTAKITDDWKTIEARIERIASRNQFHGQVGSAARMSYPLHAVHVSLKAVKF